MDRQTNLGCAGQNVVSGWAEELFGEDAEFLQAKAEQIIEEDGISLSVEMVIPLASARDWHEQYSAAINGSMEGMAKMWMFLEAFCQQIEEGLELEVGEEQAFRDNIEDWGMDY